MRSGAPKSVHARGAALASALVLAVGTACGSNSLVIGGDPEQSALSNASSGGAEPSGESGTVSGTGGTTNGLGVPSGGGAGDPNDRYPWVIWAQGEGFNYTCPPAGNHEGFTCWYHAPEGSELCEPDGAPFCNACLCQISCQTGSDCPSGRNGEAADCIGENGGKGSCFVLCEGESTCPSGMTCSTHPDTDRRVCVWVADDETWQGSPR